MYIHSHGTVAEADAMDKKLNNKPVNLLRHALIETTSIYTQYGCAVPTGRGFKMAAVISVIQTIGKSD